jgi:hypothetical protein
MPSEGRRRRAPLVLAVALLAAPAAGGVLERIVAVVDDAPVFLSEVRLLSRVQGGPEAEALEALVDERLMFREAARLPQSALTAGEEERALASIQPRVPNPTPAEQSDLRRLARREAIIVKYVEFRFRPQVRVTDEAVRAAWAEASSGRAGAPDLEAAAPAIRERLTARALDLLVEAWVKDLRQRARIRYNAAPES